MKSVNIPQSKEHFGVRFSYTIWIEIHWTPWCTLSCHVPTYSVGTLLVEMIPRIDNIASWFTHLLSFTIKNMAQGKTTMIAGAIEYGSRHCKKRVEPSACLVYRFTNVIHRKASREFVLIFEWIVPLCKGRTTWIKPAVHNVWLSNHLSITTIWRAAKFDVINIGTMQFFGNWWVFCLHWSHLLYASHAVFLTTILADPHRNRSSPITLSTNCPVFDVVEPFAHPASSCPFWSPFDFWIVFDYIFLNCSHSDEPTVHSIVEKWMICTPAMRVIVCVSVFSIETSIVLQKIYDVWITIFNVTAIQ